MADGRLKCSSCGSRTSPTAGTIFDRTRTPLTVWFAACWMFASQKDGVSALALKRQLEIGSYQTAWAMLGRLRSVLVRPRRERLSGAVEVDESYFGGRGARSARRAPEGQEGAGWASLWSAQSPVASGAVGWRRSPMLPRSRCAPSWSRTSSRAPR